MMLCVLVTMATGVFIRALLGGTLVELWAERAA